MNSNLMLCIVTALGFGAWPLIARASGVTGGWVMSVVMGVSALVSLLILRPQTSTFPAGVSLAILALAGVANGIGAAAFGKLTTEAAKAGSSLPAVALAAMIVVLTVGGFLFFKQPVSGTKLLGVLVTAVGCYLLAK